MAAILLLGSPVVKVRAQVVITEVMSYALIPGPNCGGDGFTRYPDFWELTNFSTDALDLTGYLFCDRDKVFPGEAWKFPYVVIQPGESIVLVKRSKTTSDEAFRAWWGLPLSIQIIFYPDDLQTPGYGFDDVVGDSVRLWDNHSNFVDHVDFDHARTGVTFTFDTNTGNFGVLSESGVGGAWRAPCAGDIGSPGSAPIAPISLKIVRQPEGTTNFAGADVKFQAEASGLPRPTHYRWYFNGAPLPSPNTTADFIPLAVNYAGSGLAWKVGPARSDLIITNAQASQSGEYYVVTGNGLETVTSGVARLSILTNDAPPGFISPPAELRFPAVGGTPWTNTEVSPFPYGAATFAVLVSGYPSPRVQWSWSADGKSFTDFPGATNRVLEIPYGAQPGIYRARLTNRLGSTNAYASLTVKPNPRLKITETMFFSSRLGHPDWWELSNAGDEPFNLYGCRWNDADGTLGGGPTITNSVVIRPGESVILVEGSSRDEFITWWGEANLPPDVQVITYGANGLSEDGEEITLWRPTATAQMDRIDSVGWACGDPLYCEGTSYWFAPGDVCSEFGIQSILGSCGAFRASQSLDIGSPGWTSFTPPQLTGVHCQPSGVKLDWRAQPGSTVQVEYTYSLALPPQSTTWTTLGSFTFPGAAGSATHADSPSRRTCFYRARMTAPCNCPCDPGYALEP